MNKVLIGDKIKIIHMKGEPHYKDREDVVTHIDDAGQIHGTWGGCAIIPEIDNFIILNEFRLKNLNLFQTEDQTSTVLALRCLFFITQQIK